MELSVFEVLNESPPMLHIAATMADCGRRVRN